MGASLEGWVAGSSIPCSAQNGAKLRESLKQLSGQSALARLCGWDGGAPNGRHGATGRMAAVPHIKTYARYTERGRLGWAMLTSSNLSQARARPDEKRRMTQLVVRSTPDRLPATAALSAFFTLWSLPQRNADPDPRARML